jgi:hypothetical protein
MEYPRVSRVYRPDETGEAPCKAGREDAYAAASNSASRSEMTSSQAEIAC